jgi:hypothetical protein
VYVTEVAVAAYAAVNSGATTESWRNTNGQILMFILSSGICDPTINLEVQQLLSALPKSHRAVFLLSVRERLTTGKIAAPMKLPPGTFIR